MKKICSFSRDSERERKHTSCHYLWEWCWWYSDCDWIGVDEEDDCGNDWVGRRREEVHRTMASLYFLLSVHLFAFYSGLPLSSLHLPLSTSAPSFFALWVCTPVRLQCSLCTMHSVQCTPYSTVFPILYLFALCTSLNPSTYLPQSPTYTPLFSSAALFAIQLCIPVLHCTAVRCIEITECLQTLHNAFHCMPALKCIAAQCSDQSWYEQGGGGFPYFLTSATLPLCPFATLLTSPEEIHLSYSKKYIWHILRNTLYIFTESTKYSLEK